MAWEVYTENIGLVVFDIRFIDRERQLIVQNRRLGRSTWAKDGPLLYLKHYTIDPMTGGKDILFEFRAWDDAGIRAYLNLPAVERRINKKLIEMGYTENNPYC